MQTPIELFDEWLTKFPDEPPPLRFHPIPNEIADPFRDQLSVFNSRMEWVRKQFLPNRNIDVYLDFIDDGRCNAAAWIYKYTGLIGLNKGLILIPRDLFWRMFSHPGFLPAIASGEERRSAQHDDGMTDDFDALVERRRKSNRPIYAKPPVSPVRQRMAHVCMDLVLRFTAAHELVHIVHGHCDYLRDTQSLRCILESTRHVAMPAISQSSLDRQALEFSADTVAAGMVLGGFLNLSPMVGIYAGLDDVRKRLFIWSLAMFTLFRIWDFRIDTETFHAGTHPPSAVRFAVLFAFVCPQIAMESAEIGWEEYVRIVRSGQATAEQGIAYCGGERLKQEDLDLLQEPMVKAHRDRVFEHHDDVLTPLLEKYAYVEITPTSDLPPPPQPQTPPATAP